MSVDRRIKLTVAYDGTQFHGWQFQKEFRTVQGEMTNAFFKVYGKKIDVTGCSRTDAGVHAVNFICHADLPYLVRLDKIPRAVNTFLPFEISVLKAEEAKDDFHARYDAKRKTYKYFVYNSPIRHPLYENRTCFFPYELDFEIMKEDAKKFIGTFDFKAFMVAGTEIETTVRTVYECNVKKDGSVIMIEITADGFLYNMVRIISGTLIDRARGKIKKDVKEIIESLDRKEAGFTAPACGLYLYNVEY